MQYGHFDDMAEEYVIDTPETPLPWINYLGNEDFFGLISNTAGGYDFFRDAKLRRITRYRYNAVPADYGSRFYYIAEPGTSGSPQCVWSPTFLPMATPLDRYRCRHGLGYSVFEASYHGIDTELTAFVPLHMNAEVNRLTIGNRSDRERVFDVTGCVEWCLWDAVDDATNFQRNLSTGEVEIERDVMRTLLYHKTEYKERRNHYAFFGVNRAVAGYDTDREAFLGRFHGWNRPRAVMHDGPRNSVAHGWSPIAAETVRLHLKPGESASLVFVLGYVELGPDEKWEQPATHDTDGVINKDPAHALFAQVDDDGKVDRELDALREYWKTLRSRFHVESGDERLDRMVNIWNQYQCMVTFNLSRSASYFESGVGRGMGFRDSNQDILGFVHMAPGLARQRILDLASTQLPDGSAWHQYQPLTKRGNADIGGGFNDDPLWLVAASYAYLAETDDGSILTESVPFDSQRGTEVPLLEHLRRSVGFTLAHRGPHGLPLIGRADWNDCLNLNCFSTEPGESFQTVENNDTGVAESVFIAGMFVLYAGRYAAILDRYGESCGVPSDRVRQEANGIRESVDAMSRVVEDFGWDGSWFLRAYDAQQRPVGSHIDDEGRIFLEPQGMCVMAGIGVPDGKARRALQSVHDMLTGEWGTAILAPAYSRYRVELGEISTYPRGYKENGGIFCHINPWLSIANAIVGDDEEAYAVYRRTSPAYCEERSDIRKTEPYVYCQMVAGPESHALGEGKNSWLTGTAAWSFVDVSQYLLGIRPTLDGLIIEPHLPRNMGQVKLTRVFRGVTYHITMRHAGHRSLNVNGTNVDGSLIRPEFTHMDADGNLEVIATY